VDAPIGAATARVSDQGAMQAGTLAATMCWWKVNTCGSRASTVALTQWF
jgi:hypothetical protein